MNNRDNTFFDSTIPSDNTVSGVKPVSMGSIALLQLIENPMARVILSGEDIPVSDTISMLQFVYIHTHELSEVAPLCLRYKSDPEELMMKVLEWAMTFDTNKMIEYFTDIMRDRDNVKNAKTETIKSNKKTSKSKNEPGQH